MLTTPLKSVKREHLRSLALTRQSEQYNILSVIKENHT